MLFLFNDLGVAYRFSLLLRIKLGIEPMSRLPASLARDENDNLVIHWDDQTTSTLSPIQLRDACPCATCQEKKKAKAKEKPNILPVLKLEETQPLKILAMKPIGNYAYGIRFSDGHSSGLFTIEQLSRLG